MCDHVMEARRFGPLLRHRCIECGYTRQETWATSLEKGRQERLHLASANSRKASKTRKAAESLGHIAIGQQSAAIRGRPRARK